MSGLLLALSQAEILELLTAARTQLASLVAARASGIKRVTHGDKTTEFRTDGELARAIIALETEIARLLALLAGVSPRRVARAVTFIAGKGL